MEQNRNEKLLVGAEAIAGELGLGVRQTYHAIATGKLKVRRLGRRPAALPSELRAQFSIAGETGRVA